MKITSVGKSLYSTDSNCDRFLNDTVSLLKNSKINLNLINRHNIFGEYCYDLKELKISRPEYFKKPAKSWLDLYVHEYCHFLQQYYETPIYRTYWKPLKYVISSDRELQKKPVKLVKKHLNAIRHMETECCKMSIGLIKFYKLPIDVKMSSKISNAYIFYHHLVEENYTWKSKNYYTKSILDSMPDRIRSDYADKIPDKYRFIITKCFE